MDYVLKLEPVVYEFNVGAPAPATQPAVSGLEPNDAPQAAADEDVNDGDGQ